jgi:hypothetical protein
MQMLRRFARYWDLVANSGNFVNATPLLWADEASPFAAFRRWSEWLFERAGRTDGIALARLAALLFEFLTRQRGLDERRIAESLWSDYRREGRSDVPEFLRPWIAEKPARGAPRNHLSPLKRQARHLAG